MSDLQPGTPYTYPATSTRPTPSKPLVYLAGPYTHPDPVTNTRRALGVGSSLLDDGRCVPFVPHQSLIFDLLHPRPVEDWYRLDLVLLERCDALYRLLGDSQGADQEVVHASRCGIPVFFETSPNWISGALSDWLDGWATRKREAAA